MSMAKEEPDDPAIVRIRAWLEESKTTMHDLGVRMGFDEATARKAVWQFLKSKDPRIGTLRKFAAATGMDICELIAPPKPKKVKPA